MQPCDMTAVAARAAIAAKQLSPVELIESCIARTEQVDHAVNAMVARDIDRARQAARAAQDAVMRGDRLGALHGLPVGIKDLHDAAGLVTSMGSPLYRANVAARDHRFVAAVRDAGAIVLGKTNTPEFGAGANTRNAVYGATGNPFDPSRSAAGSSGGSAVALACGMVPIATGSDTGGSLRNPAAFCGIVGFRPTPGLIPHEAFTLGWSPLSVVGPMARTVADCSLLLSAMVSDDARDPLATSVFGQRVRIAADYAVPAPIDLRGLRLAITPDFGFAPVERVVRDAFDRVAGIIAPMFAHADHAAPDCSGTDESFEVLRALGFVAQHSAKVRDAPDQVGPNVHANVQEGLRYSAADAARAMAVQTAIYRRWQSFFDEWDVIVSPAISISPRAWTELFPSHIDEIATRTYFHWLALAYAVSLVGHPAISLPVGRDAHGMPFGLQIVGPRGGDARVMAVAAALEAALAGDPGTARPVPDLARLRTAPAISASPGYLGFD